MLRSCTPVACAGPYLFPQKPPWRRNKARILTARAFDRFETSCLVYQIPRGVAPGVHKSPAPRDRDPEQTPLGCPGGGGWAQVELTDPLSHLPGGEGMGTGGID